MSADILAQKQASDAYRYLPTDLLSNQTLYDVLAIPQRLTELDASEASYLLTSEQVFERFFTSGWFTKQKPLEEAEHFEKWQQIRAFAEGLFASKTWVILEKFETGNGAATYVFGKAAQN